MDAGQKNKKRQYTIDTYSDANELMQKINSSEMLLQRRLWIGLGAPATSATNKLFPVRMSKRALYHHLRGWRCGTENPITRCILLPHNQTIFCISTKVMRLRDIKISLLGYGFAGFSSVKSLGWDGRRTAHPAPYPLSCVSRIRRTHLFYIQKLFLHDKY